MDKINAIRSALPDAAKDLNLNLSNILEGQTTLEPAQAWGVALAAAYFIGEPRLVEAILADGNLSDEAIDDAKAAASLMGMNTVYYRFRHMIGKDSYAQRPARLRMGRMAKPLTSKADFELMSMACAALAGCEMCIKSHETSILKELTEEHVHESVRIAAVLNGVTVALGIGKEG